MKNFKSLAALTAASMISLASVATPIFAEDTPNPNPTFATSVTTKDGLVTASNSTIEYAIAPATEGVQVNYNGSAAGGTVFKGTDVQTVGITMGAATQQDEVTSLNKIEYSNVTVNIANPGNFPGAGIFKYSITPTTTGTETDNKSIDINEQQFDLYLYVGYDSNNQLAVLRHWFTTPGSDTKLNQDEVVFTHTYNPNPLKVTKTVTGNQGNKEQYFDFKVTVTKPAGQTLNAKLGNVAANPTHNEDDTKYTYNFTLKDGEEFIIDGLTGDDIYSVSETPLGYEASYIKTVGATTGSKVEADHIDNVTATDGMDEEVAFTNHREGTVPTGILMTAAPYVAVVGLGGVFAGMFFRRKRED